MTHAKHASAVAATTVAASAAAWGHSQNQLSPCSPVAVALNVKQPDATPRVSPFSRLSLVRRAIVIAKRILEVLAKLFPVGSSFLRHRWLPEDSALAPTREVYLKTLVASLASLGPVGIKWSAALPHSLLFQGTGLRRVSCTTSSALVIRFDFFLHRGQWASTRYDLFSEDCCEALGALTNDAPSHPFAATEASVREAFGRPLCEVFATFDEAPLASGSIAQVHVATLAPPGSGAGGGGGPGGGRKVAVKVQHPNLAERLEVDMAILRWTADRGGERVRQTVDQFAVNFEAQLDFRDEAENLRRFNRHFDTSFWRSLVSFPVPVEGLVSSRRAGRVLTLTLTLPP